MPLRITNAASTSIKPGDKPLRQSLLGLCPSDRSVVSFHLDEISEGVGDLPEHKSLAMRINAPQHIAEVTDPKAANPLVEMRGA